MKTKLSAISIATIAALSASVSGLTQASTAPEYKNDSILVVYKEGMSPADKAAARSSVYATISDKNRDEVDDSFKHIMDGRIAKLQLSNKSVKEAIEILKQHPAVLYAEPNYIVKKAALPDDPSFGSLWGLHNTGQDGGTADADIDALEAWDISTGDSSIVIGVIDTGVDYQHEDLADNAWMNPGEIPGDGIDNDANGYVDDVYGIDTANGDSDPMDDDSHGTHVAGTIGAKGNNGIGVVGVNHDVTIAGCKFLGADGTGSTAGAIECVNYFVALKNAGVNVRATNNSWGGGGFSQALKDAITASGDADILFVAAAGNAGSDNDLSPSYPASYDNDNILAVASTTRTDGDSGYSYGLTSVDMAAPGSAILSTTPNNGYASFSGTSMATPHVTGAAALTWSVNPDLTALEMKALLMASGDDNAVMQGRTVSGKRLNVNQALIDADPTPSFKFSVTPVKTEIVAGETAVYTFEVGSISDWTGEVSLSLDSESGLGQLSASTVEPGDTFTLTVVTDENTPYGDYAFTVKGESGDIVKEKALGLYVFPQGLTDFTYSNDESIPTLPNEQDPDDVGIDSVINIPDALTVFGTSTFVNITHTYRGDLVLTLTSPAGTSAVLTANSGGGADDIVESFASDAFNGEVATGDWTLNVLDTFNGDDGTLNNWELTITGIGEVAPAAPVAAFSYEAEALSVSFNNESTDVNNDIVSHSWDFGDGTTSTEASPSHIFPATGSYEVTLTTTDAEGQSDSITQTVSVTDVSIQLNVERAHLSRFGKLRVDLSWTGSFTDTVTVYRNGVELGVFENKGYFRDRERRVDGTSFSYMVCDETTACSDEVNVTF
ncbi:S8 family serine peptidase [Aestuariibacter sp. AA17]|uniref:S8 family serine peptidase n=1 Tax=Fluctibacter corallii TaxID=2984329 RepID=A0ABT3A9U9_9ALTE|nr:S8 family serine peptidase [Aestuariibacter sp. AA17]MCV2885052.1 S8 family serine peptidase [Aestuariibacter sp. AA17]